MGARVCVWVCVWVYVSINYFHSLRHEEFDFGHIIGAQIDIFLKLEIRRWLTYTSISRVVLLVCMHGCFTFARETQLPSLMPIGGTFIIFIPDNEWKNNETAVAVQLSGLLALFPKKEWTNISAFKLLLNLITYDNPIYNIRVQSRSWEVMLTCYPIIEEECIISKRFVKKSLCTSLQDISDHDNHRDRDKLHQFLNYLIKKMMHEVFTHLKKVLELSFKPNVRVLFPGGGGQWFIQFLTWLL